MRATDEFDTTKQLREAVQIRKNIIKMYEEWLESIPVSIELLREQVVGLEERIAQTQEQV